MDFVDNVNLCDSADRMQNKKYPKKPVIGITGSFHTRWMGADRDIFHYRLKATYADSIQKAGGLPVVLPYLDRPGEVEELAVRIDGLVVSGSPEDIDPYFYGGSKKPLTGHAVWRHAFEMRLASACIESGLPVLGICGGHQLLNVLYGGTLLGDIGTCIRGAIDHRGDYFTPSHSVEVMKGSAIHSVTGSRRFDVNSSHHQAVYGLGAGLVVSALAPDGVVEAIEATGEGFVIGVQWHPESLSDRCSTRLFKALTDAAGRAVR
jgi:putative glutamine amidotransferase